MIWLKHSLSSFSHYSVYNGLCFGNEIEYPNLKMNFHMLINVKGRSHWQTVCTQFRRCSVCSKMLTAWRQLSQKEGRNRRFARRSTVSESLENVAEPSQVCATCLNSVRGEWTTCKTREKKEGRGTFISVATYGIEVFWKIGEERYGNIPMPNHTNSPIEMLQLYLWIFIELLPDRNWHKQRSRLPALVPHLSLPHVVQRFV